MAQRSGPAGRGGRWNPGTWSQAAFVSAIMGAVVLLGLAIFGLFAVLAPNPGGGAASGWVYDVARSAIAGLGLVTIGGGAAIAYRRQRTLDAGHELEIRRNTLTERSNLHERYQLAAAQLGHEKPMIRIAGVYALEALAHEWAHFGAIDQRDVCIDLLCGYLRTPPELAEDEATAGVSLSTLEAEVRSTIAAVLARNLRRDAMGSPGKWSGHQLDLRNAYMAEIDFTNVTVRVSLTGARVEGCATFAAAHFPDQASFRSATFGGQANFSKARFSRPVDFRLAAFHRDAGFEEAEFAGHVNFGEAHFARNATFAGANVEGGAAFGGARLDRIVDLGGTSFRLGPDFSMARIAGPVMTRQMSSFRPNFRGATVDAPYLTDELRSWGATVADAESGD